MEIWIIFALIGAGFVFLIDLLLRRKKWNANTKVEKVSLIVHMASIGPNLFLSALGLLWGIGGGSPKTVFGEVMYEVTLYMAAVYFIIALVATITAFVLRKIGKAKASTWVNIISIAYAVGTMLLNYLVSIIL